ncbi:N-acetylmannosamine-6-phosphate 2-epimerase [Candidatus Cyanaurora vandensis]|uniref:N-acetylmannosamine-6-phosphate 2-epimerase n=1 Tax=Candidatus Cyanaurora vandensis TaxID=2714958 RepID=UPI00257A18BB|nr:N-acetylmannosamine-6-phosphate 2-epimerase [Candidatus Cyanaurora vandensis]
MTTNTPRPAASPIPAAASLLKLRGGLVVSCQAPPDSPLHEPLVIAAMAQASINNGALGVRIDSPVHIQAVRARVTAPIIGLWKIVHPGFEVYITPGLAEVQALKLAGCDVIAADATDRPRPGNCSLQEIIAACHADPFCPVLADVSTVAEAVFAVSCGADAVATTLYGYTPDTAQNIPPAWSLLRELIATVSVPVILEGGVQTPTEVQRALDLGAWAIVVGGALTGLDQRVRQFCPLT